MAATRCQRPPGLRFDTGDSFRQVGQVELSSLSSIGGEVASHFACCVPDR